MLKKLNLSTYPTQNNWQYEENNKQSRLKSDITLTDGIYCSQDTAYIPMKCPSTRRFSWPFVIQQPLSLIELYKVKHLELHEDIVVA